MNSVYTLEPRVFNMYFNIILPSTPNSARCYGLTKILYASLMHLLRSTYIASPISLSCAYIATKYEYRSKFVAPCRLYTAAYLIIVFSQPQSMSEILSPCPRPDNT